MSSERHLSNSAPKVRGRSHTDGPLKTIHKVRATFWASEKYAALEASNEE